MYHISIKHNISPSVCTCLKLTDRKREKENVNSVDDTEVYLEEIASTRF